MTELELRPLDHLWQACDLLGAAMCVSSLEGLDGASRLRLLAVVKPAPTAVRWHSRRERLKHGTTLASCDLGTRPRIEEAAEVLLDVLGPVLAEAQRREAA